MFQNFVVYSSFFIYLHLKVYMVQLHRGNIFKFFFRNGVINYKYCEKNLYNNRSKWFFRQ